MKFSHDPAIWSEFPHLAADVVFADAISTNADPAPAIATYIERARTRLEGVTESELPEIQAWRRAFSQMGLKPTQYRSASEALLRRFRKDGSLPPLHPLVDLCNALSLAWALPIAVIDLDQVAGDLTVRHAQGDESYETFGGEIEQPEPGEVIFADGDRNVHARRWCNRQSGRSAIRPETRRVLIVTEAMHEGGRSDIDTLAAAIATEVGALWGNTSAPVSLRPEAPIADSDATAH